jgi:RNA polymerase sigma-70 factor, ECF subfamily
METLPGDRGVTAALRPRRRLRRDPTVQPRDFVGRVVSPGVSESDAELVERVRSGDSTAFATLVRRYQPALLRLAVSVVPSRAVAEEAVQDTWLGVVRGIERFEGTSSFKTWLFHILVNRARSAGAKERRTETLPEDDDPLAGRFERTGAWATPPVPWAEAADDRVTAAQLARKVREHLMALPAGQREVVLLHDVEAMPPVEVCSVLGINDGHRRVLLHRGRARVRQLLEADMVGS